MSETKYKVLNTNKLPNSEMEIEVEITAAYVESFWTKALAHLNEHATVDGFRPGKIPEKVLIAKIGEMSVVEECAEMALAEAYPEILTEEKINAIGRPRINITKMAKGSPLTCKIKLAVMPEVKLPNYKKIAKENADVADTVEVTDKEIDDLIQKVRESRAPHNHAPGEEHKDDKKLELPDFTDDFVKSLGEFSDIEDFKDKMKENMKAEKEYRNKEKKRLSILEALAKETAIEIPELLIESEQDKMYSQFTENLKSMGLDIPDYLKRVAKTEAEIKSEWKPEAEKRAKIQLITNQIAIEEKILPTEEELSAEVKKLIELYPGVDDGRARIYADIMITNDKVMQFLESQK